MPRASNVALVLGGLAATFALLHRRVMAGDGVLPVATVRNYADDAARLYGLEVDPAMIVRIAWIESSFNPSAVRYEPHIGDSSAGLMQTLLGTARWLATEMGYKAFGVPSLDHLLLPQESIYFGAAYLDWLRTYKGSLRSEEWVVRSYNGGPGHGDAATDAYWRKYLKAKERFG